jgi:hypothetical protein
LKAASAAEHVLVREAWNRAVPGSQAPDSSHQKGFDMDSKYKVVANALLAMAMLLGVTRVSHTAERVADPAIWGVYAKLVGTSWKGELGTRATRWGEGDQMIEEDASFGRSVITLGPTPGTLALKLGTTGLHSFQGAVASDGSVLWIRDGMLKMPYRVLLQDGELLEEQVKLSGREVASVKRTLRYQQVDGPVAGSQTLASVAIAKTTPAVATPVARESVDAPANAGPEAIWGIYARLVGSTLNVGKKNGPPTSWRWGDGDEIIQDMGGDLRKIRRGAAVGELVALDGKNFERVWNGTVATDGSVVFVDAKETNWLLKYPSQRISLSGDDVLVEEVKIKDGRVVQATQWLRYVGQIGGADRAAPAAAVAAVTPVAAVTSVTPVVAVAPVVPVMSSGGLEPFIGRRLFSAESSDFVEFLRGDDGTLVIQFYSLNGATGGRYVIGASSKKPGKLEMLTSAYYNERHYRDVNWQTDGSLYLTSKSGMFGGWFHNYTFRAEDDKVVFRRWGHEVSKIGMFTGREFNESGTYTAPTAALISVAKLNEAWSQAQAAEAAREQRLAKIESDRALARSFNIMMGDLSDHAAKETQIRADADAMLADTQRQMMAAQEQQAADLRQQSQLKLQAQQATALQQRQAAEAASHPATAPSAASTTAGGTLTIESVAQSARAAPAASTNSGEEFMYCWLLKPGSFEGHNGARFYSAVTKVVIRYGQVQTASENFLADVKAAYGVNGPSMCTSNKDRAALESVLQEALNVRSYQAFKTVMTGIPPRN